MRIAGRIGTPPAAGKPHVVNGPVAGATGARPKISLKGAPSAMEQLAESWKRPR